MSSSLQRMMGCEEELGTFALMQRVYGENLPFTE